MVEPTFTVAMPAYNAERTITSSIKSVLAQTRQDFELIVVDDGSSDGTVERIRAFGTDSRVQLVRQQNSGPGAARNRAIRSGKGRYISMLDSDDLWLPTYLETMAKTLDADPAAGMAYTDAWVLDDATGRIRRTTAMAYQHPPGDPPLDPQEFLAMLLDRRNFVFTSTTLRRQALETVGLFKSALKPAEDYDMWLRIVASGYRALRTPGVLAVYRKHPGSLSTDEAALLQGERAAVELIANRYDLPDWIRARARSRLRKLDLRAAGLGDDRSLRATLARGVARAVRVKSAALEPFAWYAVPPAPVASLLAAVDSDDDGSRASRQA